MFAHAAGCFAQLQKPRPSRFDHNCDGTSPIINLHRKKCFFFFQILHHFDFKLDTPFFWMATFAFIWQSFYQLTFGLSRFSIIPDT